MKKVFGVCLILLLIGSTVVLGDVLDYDSDGDKSKNPWLENMTVPVEQQSQVTTKGEDGEIITVDSGESNTDPGTINFPEYETTNASGSEVKKTKKIAKPKIVSATKKNKKTRKVKLKIKKDSSIKGYQVAIYKTKKNAKKNKKAILKRFFKRTKVTVKSRKLRNRTKLWVKVRAYVITEKGKKKYGTWSKVKRVKVKKK